MNKTISILTVLIVLMAASGCNSSQVALTPPVTDGKNTYEQFISSNIFPYSIGDKRKKQIIGNYETIRIGMTKVEFSSILGEPDFSESLYTKESPGRLISTHWTYYFYKPSSDLVNEKLDRGVFIYFGTDNKADRIVPQNIDGLV